MKQTAEIFRHLRPVWFDSGRCEVHPELNGGISFYLRPAADEFGVYDYWLYICPMDIPFSTRVAVKALRDRADKEVLPWGRIVMNEDPLIIQLLKSVMSEADMQSDASKMAFEIIMTVWAAESRRNKSLQSTAHKEYEDDHESR